MTSDIVGLSITTRRGVRSSLASANGLNGLAETDAGDAALASVPDCDGSEAVPIAAPEQAASVPAIIATAHTGGAGRPPPRHHSRDQRRARLFRLFEFTTPLPQFLSAACPAQTTSKLELRQPLAAPAPGSSSDHPWILPSAWPPRWRSIRAPLNRSR